MKIFAEQPGAFYDPPFWHAVFALYEQAFPGLPAGIDRAAAIGLRWADVTTPFAMFEGDRCISHVGVLSHPMYLDGREVQVAGIHAVCTAPDRRGRGLCRELLGQAVAWASRSHDVCKLHTDAPAIYERHGFHTVPTWRFRSSATPAKGVRRRLLLPSTSPEDARRLRAMLADRTPVSFHCASRDDGSLVEIVAALGRRLDGAMWLLPEHEAIVVLDEGRTATLVVDVFARRLPHVEVIVGAAADPGLPLHYAFTPDRIEPAASAEPAPAALGSFLVRGIWPVASPFGISPLWEH